MSEGESWIERVTKRLRRNPVVATLIVVGVVLAWLASFTDSVKKLSDLLPSARPAAVAGQWTSESLKDARSKLDFRYVFDLKTDGGPVIGSARRVIPYCEEHKSSGICQDDGRAVAILNGTIEKRTLSFTVDWGEVPGSEPWTWVKLKETFRGTVDGKTIRFVRQDDANDPPVEFVASQ